MNSEKWDSRFGAARHRTEGDVSNLQIKRIKGKNPSILSALSRLRDASFRVRRASGTQAHKLVVYDVSRADEGRLRSIVSDCGLAEVSWLGNGVFILIFDKK